MENKINEVRKFIIKERDKSSFKIAGFYIEFIIKKFNVNKNEALEITNKLIQEGLITRLTENTCSQCNNVVYGENETYCKVCEEEIDLKNNYYKVL